MLPYPIPEWGILCATKQGEARLDLGDLILIQANGARTLTMGQAVTGVFQAASDLQPVRVVLARSARHGGLPRSIRLLGRGDPLQYPDRFAPFQKKKGEFPPCNGGNLLYKLL